MRIGVTNSGGKELQLVNKELDEAILRDVWSRQPSKMEQNLLAIAQAAKCDFAEHMRMHHRMLTKQQLVQVQFR